MLMQGQHSVRLPLSLSLLRDFSQSRLLINFQNHQCEGYSNTFSTAVQINRPTSTFLSVACRSGWYDTHGLIPSLPHRRCHVNFSPGGSRCPLRVLPQQQERCFLIACSGAGQTLCNHAYSLLSVRRRRRRGVSTVLTWWARLHSQLLETHEDKSWTQLSLQITLGPLFPRNTKLLVITRRHLSPHTHNPLAI